MRSRHISRGLFRSGVALAVASLFLVSPLVAGQALAADPPLTCRTSQGWIDSGVPTAAGCLQVVGTAAGGQQIVQDPNKPYTPVVGWTAVPVQPAPAGAGGPTDAVTPSDPAYNPALPKQDQYYSPGVAGGFIG